MEMCGARTSRVLMKGMDIAALLVNLLPGLLESFRHLEYEESVVVIVDYLGRRC
jgi:hypothetical protein